MSDRTLAQLREKLGFSAGEVAAAGGWSRRDFERLEASAELDVQDALKLNDIYGVDVGSVLESGKPRADLPVAALLKGKAEVLTADTRFAMTEAMSVARDIRTVEDILEIQADPPVTSFREDRDLSHPSSGHVQQMAAEVRKHLGLQGPIQCLMRDVIDRLGIVVFACELNDPLLDAFSAWSSGSGAVIVANVDSPRIRGPLGLRATLAHEVCHLLFDRFKMRKINSFCEIERPTKERFQEWDEREKIEQRARAFQAELLAPQHDLVEAQKSVNHQPPELQLAHLCATWGLGPVAIAWQLRNGGGPDLTHSNVAFVQDSAYREWDEIVPREEPRSIPRMRRGKLLDTVKRALRENALSVSWAREILRMSVGDFDRLFVGWMS